MPEDNKLNINSNSKSLNHDKGMESEDRAAAYLSDLGYKILERNFRFHRNEIDIIALDDRTYVFVEVKKRSSVRLGYGYQAVNSEKQKRIRKVAEAYLVKNRLGMYDTPCRFDIISIDMDKLSHIKNAF